MWAISPGPGQSLLDGLGRLVGDDHGRGMVRRVGAGVLEPHVLQDEQVGRCVLQLLGHHLADEPTGEDRAG